MMRDGYWQMRGGLMMMGEGSHDIGGGGKALSCPPTHPHEPTHRTPQIVSTALALPHLLARLHVPLPQVVAIVADINDVCVVQLAQGGQLTHCRGAGGGRDGKG